jgi:predicted permease
MSTRLRLRSLWRNSIHRDSVERDLDDEIRAMFELAVAERIASGMPPDEARRAAAREFGRVDAIKDRVRDVRAGALIESVIQDVRYGARMLRRNPIFAIAAALSLAIGIGATTAIFTVANGLLLRVAPGVTEPDRLVDVVPTLRGHFGLVPSSYEMYRQLHDRVTTLSDVYAYTLEPQARSLRTASGAERIFATMVSANYFTALGVPAHAGRVFDGSERTGSAAAAAVVLSHEFWTRRLNADPGVVGHRLHLNGRPYDVAGVAREGFRGLSVAAPDVWIPIEDDTPQLMIGGRLKPDTSRAQAAAEIRTLGHAFARETSRTSDGMDWNVAAASPLPAAVRGIAAGFVGLLLALVSVVLVIACANLAGVLLARASARRREIAVRVAIGAGRTRVMRQLITETLLIFVLGASGGVALARVFASALPALLPAFPVPVALALPIDGRVLAFSAGLSLVSALLSGLAPALHASRADVVTALKDEAQGPSDPLRLRQTFVVAQVAFSILLVVIAGLLGRALGRITFADEGFNRRGVDVASVDLSMAGYNEFAGLQFAGELRARALRISGVTAATVADRLPGGPLVMEATRRARGDEGGKIEPPRNPASWTRIAPGYFTTLRIPLVAGRDFTDGDRRGSQPVAIIDESTARLLWPGQDPIGKLLPASVPVPGGGNSTPLVVVGVAADVMAPGRQRNPAVPCIYAPLQQMYSPRLTVISRSDRGGRAGDLRRLVTAIDRDVPVLAAQALADSQYGPVLVQLRVAALVSGSVGIIGLLLASLGIYGVTAYVTTQRTREIGIRMTLGAQRQQIMWMILRHGLKLVAIGSTAGLALAAVAGRLMARSVLGLPSLDVVIFAGAATLFAGIGLAACYLPAWRATRVTAMEALRYE